MLENDVPLSTSTRELYFPDCYFLLPQVPITRTRSSMEKTLQWIVPVANNTARYYKLGRIV